MLGRQDSSYLTIITQPAGSRNITRIFMRKICTTMTCITVLLFIFYMLALKTPSTASIDATLIRADGTRPKSRIRALNKLNGGEPVSQNGFEVALDSVYDDEAASDVQELGPLKKKVLIVGAGLSGAVIGERIANTCKGYSVTIVDQRDHIGGNCFDYIDNETDIRVHKYGAHIFHTSDAGVWEYLSKFTRWTPYQHRVLTKIATGQLVQVPVNIHTVNEVFKLNIKSEEEMKAWLRKNQVKPPGGASKNSEETAKSRVGNRLYELLFKHYTKKQWDKYPEELAPTVLERIPVRSNADGRYFTDTYQALPSRGYTNIFRRMLTNRKIYVKLNTEYFSLEKEGSLPPADYTFFTGPIDQFFASAGLPKLEYRSLVFHREVFNTNTSGFYQPTLAVNYGTPEIPYTRSIEYAHFPNQDYDPTKLMPIKTVVVHETSTDNGEPYYPVPNDRNLNLFAKYQKMAEEKQEVVFVGRLASYKYFDMDDAVRNALNTFEKWVKGNNLQEDCDLSMSQEFLEEKKSDDPSS